MKMILVIIVNIYCPLNMYYPLFYGLYMNSHLILTNTLETYTIILCFTGEETESLSLSNSPKATVSGRTKALDQNLYLHMTKRLIF